MPNTTALVVDDSRTARKALVVMLENQGIRVIGQAASGQEALSLSLSLQPDVITMDVQMPGMDGLEATRAILARRKARIVIVSSAGEIDQEDLSFKALAAGALEMLPKPTGERPSDILESGRRLAQRVLEIASSEIYSTHENTPSPLNENQGPFTAVGIAASTGGPPVIAKLLGAFKAPPPFSILIAQHIAYGFTAGFARWLNSTCNLNVRVVESSLAAKPGNVYLPIDGHDLAWKNNRIMSHPSLGGSCPSANRLFRSLADHLTSKAAGLVLTGMGRDGADGLFEMHRAGSQTAIQSLQSCVVNGMPQAAATMGAATSSGSPEDLSKLLQKWAHFKKAGD